MKVKWESSRGMENGDTLLFITADRKWQNEHDPQSMDDRDDGIILNLIQNALYVATDT